jgi:ketosteroid isomerase-like protein
MNMPERIDDKLQYFLSNLVSSKHSDLMEMLTEDAVMEFPYHLPTTPTQLVGKQEIVKYFAGIENLMTFDEFRLVAAHQTINPDAAVLEYEGTGKAVQTGRFYQQKYITVLIFRDGRISHWKDYWNPISVLNAIGESDSEHCRTSL